MAAYNKVQPFIEEVFEKVHNMQSDTLKWALSNTAPTATSNIYNTTNFPAPAAANGYTAGGNVITVSSSAQTTGTYKNVMADSTFTATAGGIGPFRYVIGYNFTSASTTIFGYYDYGSSITLTNVGDSFTVDADPTTGVIQAS